MSSFWRRRVYLTNKVEKVYITGALKCETHITVKSICSQSTLAIKEIIFIILWKMSAVYAWNKRKSMCAWNECSTGKLLTPCLNSLTRVCLCCTASVTPSCVVLETLIFLQNACRTMNAIFSLDSPICQFASGRLEITLVAHGFYVPWLQWKSQMWKDWVRKKSSIQEWFHTCRYPRYRSPGGMS